MATTIVILVAVILVWPVETLAYLGPGLGAGTIAVVLGFIGSIFLALFALLYYPIKRAFKKRKNKQTQAPKDQVDTIEEDLTKN